MHAIPHLIITVAEENNAKGISEYSEMPLFNYKQISEQ